MLPSMTASLSRSPVQRALALLRKAAQTSPNFLVAASGGKDSNALFPLLQELGRELPIRVACFHMYLPVPGLDCVERPIHVLRHRLGDCPIYYVPHFALPDHLWLGDIRERTAETKRRAKPLKATTCEDAARCYFAAHLSGLPDGTVQAAVNKSLGQADEDEEGTPAPPRIAGLTVNPWTDIWVLAGQRSRDSLERRAMLSSFRKQAGLGGVATGGAVGFNVKERRVYPLHDWTTSDVLAYCRVKRVPPPPPLGGLNTMNLDPSQPKVMGVLRRLYPKDYEKVLSVFPYARAED